MGSSTSQSASILYPFDDSDFCDPDVQSRKTDTRVISKALYMADCNEVMCTISSVEHVFDGTANCSIEIDLGRCHLRKPVSYILTIK